MDEQKEVADAYEGLKQRRKALEQLYSDYTGTLKTQYNDWNGAVDALLRPTSDFNEAWGKASPERRTELANEIRSELPARADELEGILRQLANARDKAWLVIRTGIALLAVLGAFYLYLHAAYRAQFNDPMVEHQLFTSIGIIKGELKKQPPDWVRIHTAAQALPAATDTDDLLVAELDQRLALLKGMLTVQPAAPQPKAGEPAKPGDNANAQAAAPAQPVVDVLTEEINKLEKDSLQLGSNDGFFWVGGGWRWLEIAFWGEFGVLVGILVWVSGRAAKSLYTEDMYVREQYWYVAEVFIGPFVVVAVFFLLKQFVTVILTGVTEADVRASIYLTLGISFTLGLFVRRTLGIFNLIKSKLPLPGS